MEDEEDSVNAENGSAAEYDGQKVERPEQSLPQGPRALSKDPQKFIELAKAAAEAKRFPFTSQVVAQLVSEPKPYWDIVSRTESGSLTKVKVDAITGEILGEITLTVSVASLSIHRTSRLSLMWRHLRQYISGLFQKSSHPNSNEHRL